MKDKKGSFDKYKLDKDGMAAYLGVCSLCLARAHARTGDAAVISGYLVSGIAFDEAISKFATAYADQSEYDYQLILDASHTGRISAETGI